MSAQPSPSVRKRDALRAAIRNHPDNTDVLNGRLVSSLTMAELIEAVNDLGMDPDQIAAGIAPVVPDVATDDDTADEATTIASEVAKVRDQINRQGFSALDDILSRLVTEARKPPVTIEVEVPVAGSPVIASKPTGKDATWRTLFKLKGALGQRVTDIWDGAHPDTPRVNTRYIWPQIQTGIALTQIARGRNVLLYGPAGCGKTAWAQQLAAVTGRPFALISCDSATDGPTLVGMTVPSVDGTKWQDGQLTRAIRSPGCVICLDEPSVARPGALFVLQNVLANRELFISETGERVRVAKGVVFVSTDNTNGMGGGSRRGYTDTNRLNAAFLDRFGVRVRFDYMPAAQERDIVVSYTGCTEQLADLLITAAATTRAAADNQTLSHGIGLRRLLSWAELLTDGIEPEEAFQSAVLNCAAEQDVETLRQQCLLAYDRTAVIAALNPAGGVDTSVNADPTISNPSAAGRNAAQDFAA